MPTPIVAPRKLIFYRLGSLTDRISIGNPRDSVQTYFFYDGNNLRADAVFLDPGIYIPSVRDLIQGTEQFVSSIGSFTGTGAQVVTKADPLVGNIVGIQVTAPTGTAAQLGGTLTLNPNKVVFGSGGGIEDPNTQASVNYTGILELSPPEYRGTPLVSPPTLATTDPTEFLGLQNNVLGIQSTYTPNRSAGGWQFKITSGNVSGFSQMATVEDLNIDTGALIESKKFADPIMYDRLLVGVFETGLNSTELPSSFTAIGESRESFNIRALDIFTRASIVSFTSSTATKKLHDFFIRFSSVVQSEDEISATVELETTVADQESTPNITLNPFNTASTGSPQLVDRRGYYSQYGSCFSSGTLTLTRT